MAIFNIRNLSVSFTNKVLNNVSLHIGSNNITAIIGKSGSGKSTFLNVLLGIEKPTTGTVEFLGRDISQMGDKEFSYYHTNEISMVFQHYNLLENMSCLDNVILPLLIGGESRKCAQAKADELFSKFSMIQLKNQKAGLLSGGEKQRVAIIRALITSPKAILCDEPTGALDYQNSVLVMEMFKQISKQIAIILVSHNKELVYKYADRIITFQDGCVVSDSNGDEQFNKEHQFHLTKQKHSKKWTSLFVKLNLKENRNKNALSLLASSFGFLAIFLSAGFSFGSQQSELSALKRNYAAGFATVSSTTIYEIENSPLNYEKRVRPSLSLIDEKIQGIASLKCEPNCNYVFSPYPSGKYLGTEIDGFELVPRYDLNFEDSLIISQSLDLVESLTSVVINEEFANLMHLSGSKSIDEIIQIDSSSTISFNTGNSEEPIIKDNFSYSLNLKICGVVKEFSFLNGPKIYYSYSKLKEYLSSMRLDNISKYKKEFVSPFNLVENAKEDDAISSYSYNIFITDTSELESLFLLIDSISETDDGFKIESKAYEIKNSYIQFMSSFSDALFVFIAIAFLGVNFILGMVALSNFIEHKKETAILTCLGAKNNEIRHIYLKQNFLLIIASFLISAILLYPIQFFLNRIIYQCYGLPNLINVPIFSYLNIPFSLPLSVILIALLFSSLFIIVPLLFYRHISITNELRDE